ncbi:MAG TPA: imidazoleglycerol-phosphate dehydratase HisB [Planctomycetota bacterium]|nr:imidazoleglycerol-phosphate dehydratase HisB [Planctomycetota bacterium]
MTTDHRRATVERKTRETEIRVSVDLDGSGEARVETPIGFLTHMLETLGRHALVDLEVRVAGDLHVDQHHTVEDTGMVLGAAIGKALGERRGISRAGWARHPMDEALADAAIDLSGRAHLTLEADFDDKKVGELRVSLLHDFFEALARALGANVHLDLVRGRNDHHRVEAIFKAFARALRMAIAREPRLGEKVLSAKGSLDLGGSIAGGGG